MELVFSAETLSDGEKTLGDYGVYDGATIYVKIESNKTEEETKNSYEELG